MTSSELVVKATAELQKRIDAELLQEDPENEEDIKKLIDTNEDT